ncbi:hypothetical protein EMIHUDRAFT_205709 [Emiliania huxleyi CCMP1516]|uniref:Peptidase S8/S53 domain-containing protein n=2 Tax=Emiliania huxleyi TaxID=2903 RepID=A0A0D3JSW4_EMIH1|nr:hypothetical protein EMIHUDRAFT_205709 [Emiliania huxleyi CCMP1516]EOD26599.1 hypothetical protein EMIHUDRAFT_205709 [Emiliania huxleyi CCMP1516]|eukprot:XP_005779028.1 hypothetical protein EMIHUDRAFT_205709 [Emiliania huxleyi CCMP1516]
MAWRARLARCDRWSAARAAHQPRPHLSTAPRAPLAGEMVAANGGGCAAQGQGTSYACPVASGVVALMLEAAPQLTYRDVQGILAQTSYMTDPDDEGWTTNEAGYHHNAKYGFGMVDAQAAVEAAQSWEPWRAGGAH